MEDIVVAQRAAQVGAAKALALKKMKERLHPGLSDDLRSSVSSTTSQRSLIRALTASPQSAKNTTAGKPTFASLYNSRSHESTKPESRAPCTVSFEDLWEQNQLLHSMLVAETQRRREAEAKLEVMHGVLMSSQEKQALHLFSRMQQQQQNLDFDDDCIQLVTPRDENNLSFCTELSD